MSFDRRSKMNQPSGVIVGPTGKLLSINDLPPPNTQRWVMRHKAEVVLAVRGGLVSTEEVCERYRLSKEELWSWGRLLDRHGVPGLRTTQLQNYRVSAGGRHVLSAIQTFDR